MGHVEVQQMAGHKGRGPTDPVSGHLGHGPQGQFQIGGARFGQGHIGRRTELGLELVGLIIGNDATADPRLGHDRRDRLFKAPLAR